MTESPKDYWPQKRRVLHGRNEQRFRELKAQIRKNRGVRIPLPGDSRTALQMLTRERRTEEQRRLATEDPLTGLKSRRYFDFELERMLAFQKRELFEAQGEKPEGVSPLPFGVCIGDLRKLKPVNDTYGHAGGDATLQAVAEGVRAASLRAGDAAARTGGDEFSFLFSETKDQDGKSVMEGLVDVALRVLERIHDQRISCGGKQLEPAHLDMGIALATFADTTASVRERADNASYLAKRILQAGDQRVVVAVQEKDGVRFVTAEKVNEVVVFQKISNAEEVLATKPTM